MEAIMKKTYSIFLVLLLLCCSELSGQNRVVVDFSSKGTGLGYEGSTRYTYSDIDVYYNGKLYTTERVSYFPHLNNAGSVDGLTFLHKGRRFDFYNQGSHRGGFNGRVYVLNQQTKEMIKFENDYDIQIWLLQSYYEAYEFRGINKPYFPRKPVGRVFNFIESY